MQQLKQREAEAVAAGFKIRPAVPAGTGAPIWTPQDKAWALALIERTPCTCTRLYSGEYAKCERCDFLRKFTSMRGGAAHG